MNLATAGCGSEEFEKRLRLPGEFPDAVELFGTDDNDGFPALLHDSLRPVGPNASEDFAELRLRFMQLPHAGIGHNAD
ncbi:MAG TPA: hypothetical protein VHY33_01405 [Thermoanaerobaculia bacterium]|jgi:hypothetical protein|nr:hypothetical protein [Thermoanaerobaculia bacterium]